MSSSIPDPVPPHATPEQLRHILNYWRIEANCNYGRWTTAMDDLSELRKENTARAAENERLRKAGDAMRDCVDSDIFPNIIAAWNAAKEGRDAK